MSAAFAGMEDLMAEARDANGLIAGVVAGFRPRPGGVFDEEFLYFDPDTGACEMYVADKNGFRPMTHGDVHDPRYFDGAISTTLAATFADGIDWGGVADAEEEVGAVRPARPQG